MILLVIHFATKCVMILRISTSALFFKDKRHILDQE